MLQYGCSGNLTNPSPLPGFESQVFQLIACAMFSQLHSVLPFQKKTKVYETTMHSVCLLEFKFDFTHCHMFI